MSVRLALPTDAAPITAMYNAAVPGIAAFYPGGASVMAQSYWDERIAAGQVYVSSATANGAVRGFIARRPMAFEGRTGDLMDFWIIPTSSTDAQLKAWTKELWIRWAQDFPNVAYLWGRNVGAYPVKTEKVWARLAAVGLKFRREGVWRIAAMSPADLLAVLGAA